MRKLSRVYGMGPLSIILSNTYYFTPHLNLQKSRKHSKNCSTSWHPEARRIALRRTRRHRRRSARSRLTPTPSNASARTYTYIPSRSRGNTRRCLRRRRATQLSSLTVRDFQVLRRGLPHVVRAVIVADEHVLEDVAEAGVVVDDIAGGDAGLVAAEADV
jgi:hypothetical protein